MGHVCTEGRPQQQTAVHTARAVRSGTSGLQPVGEQTSVVHAARLQGSVTSA